MVQTFAANRTDHAFHVSPLPRRSRRAENFFDVHDFDSRAEFIAIDAIPISQQVFQGTIERKCFELLCRPFCGGMRGDVEVDDAPAIMLDDDEDEQDLE